MEQGVGKEFGKYVAFNVMGALGLSCYILADTYFVAAGAGAAAGIVRLHGGTPRQAELAAITLVGTLLGMICDGAKESCGLKVSNAASEAWSAAMLALENRGIRNTQGIISPDIHELGITLREFNEKIFSAADSVMIGLMTRQNRSAESRA